MSASLRELRASLAPFRYRPAALAALHLTVVCALYTAAFAGALRAPDLPVRVLCGLFAGIFSGNLFMMGHDACHGSFTASPRLNELFGRIAFLSSYHPYGPWESTHNHIHHVFTNLKSRDFVWTPLSRAEYAERSPLRRWLYRAYRTPLGIALYYPIEIWSRWLAFPPRKALVKPRPIHGIDRALVLTFFVAQLAAIGTVAKDAPTPISTVLGGIMLAVLLPWSVFSWMIGFVTYFNHTHPKVRWFERREEWSALAGTIDGTVHLEFPRWSRLLSSNIMNHVAHHLDPHVPLVRLHVAQARVTASLPGRVLVQPWSMRALLDVQRHCRLYDYERHRWLDYDGRPTTPCSFQGVDPGGIPEGTAS
jgi:omega-6 fatty acid desaturase (delta-12 desaturase)